MTRFVLWRGLYYSVQLKVGSLMSLSEQQLVDCDVTSDACDDGYPDKAINFT